MKSFLKICFALAGSTNGLSLKSATALRGDENDSSEDKVERQPRSVSFGDDVEPRTQRTLSQQEIDELDPMFKHYDLLDRPDTPTSAASEPILEPEPFHQNGPEEVDLIRKPLTTGKYFSQFCARKGVEAFRAAKPYKNTQAAVFGMMGLYVALKMLTPSLFHEGSLLHRPELWVFELMFWFFLGIVTTIGMGVGFPSGPIFLFPHVFNTVTVGEACGGSLSDVSVLYLDRNHFQCPHAGIEPGEISFMEVYWKLAPLFIVWGLGTALGELPPYFLAKTAKEKGDRNSEAAREIEEAQKGTGVMAWMGRKTIELIESWGFWGIFLLASYPNALFDMSGLACGWVGIPFWTFFKALILGKGFHKSSLEVGVFIGLFRQSSFESMCEWVRPIGAESMLRDARLFLTSMLQRFDPQAIMDTFGSDGVLSRDALESFLRPTVRGRNLQAVTDRVLLNWDTDGDGALSFDELYGVTSADGQFAVTDLDPKPMFELSIAGIFDILKNLMVFVLVAICLKTGIEHMAGEEASRRFDLKQEREQNLLEDKNAKSLLSSEEKKNQ
eukprot:gene184-343_t